MTIKQITTAVLGGMAALIVFTLPLGSWYTIDAGERGVILRNGAVRGLAQPGLNFKLPIIDSVQYVSVQSRKIAYDNVASYSKDQQPADMTVSINYRVMPDAVGDVYTSYGSLEGLEGRIIVPRLFSNLKNVFGQFNAEGAIRERSALNAEVQAAVIANMPKFVIIEGVQIENIDFSDAFEKAVEERAQAEVEVAKFRQNAEREKVTGEITETKAKAAANATRAQAEAAAEATRMTGEAEAKSIEARGKALRDNPGLVDLIKAERWNGQLPTTMIPGGAMPMISLSAGK